MLIRLLGVAAVCCALSTCANPKQAEQDDSKSILRKANSGSEIHGEVGAMYGARVR